MKTKNTLLSVGILIMGVAIASGIVLNTTQAQISNPHPTPPANSVTATMLQAGIISDSHISATAAISPTKIATTSTQDFLNNITETYRGNWINAGTTTYENLNSVYLGTDTNGNVISKGNSLNTIEYFNAGTAITKGQTLAIGVTQGISSIGEGAAATATSTPTSTQHYWGITYTIGSNVVAANTGYFQGQSSGTDTPSTTLYLYNTDGQFPTGTPIATGTITFPTSSISTANYNFTTNVTMNPSTTYAIVIKVSSSSDGAVAMTVRNPKTCPTCQFLDGGTNGTSWISVANTSAYGTISNFAYVNGYVYPTNAASSSDFTYKYFVGFANADTSANNAVAVTENGNYSSSSWFTYPALYYLSNTTGTISTASGTNSQIVGLATSSSTLIIKHNNF